MREEAHIRIDFPRWTIPYFALCFLAQIWPLAGVANRIEPRILGLPFFLSWYVIWVFLIFLGLLVLYRTSLDARPRETAEATRPRSGDPSGRGNSPEGGVRGVGSHGSERSDPDAGDAP